MFIPWKGACWGQAGNVLAGTRLLILGESHYCAEDTPHLVGQCQPGLTRHVVEELALRKSHRFFTGLTQIVSGRPKWQMTAVEVRAVWDAVAFYNYVPVYVAVAPRVRPTREMWDAGREPFRQALEDLKPEAIIVCGNDLWGELVRALPGQDRTVAATGRCRVGDALAAKVMHPSANFFSSNKVRPIVERLLADARMVDPTAIPREIAIPSERLSVALPHRPHP